VAVQQSTQKEKKAYTKPQVTEVRLVAGQAVLGNCKDGSAGICLPDLACASSQRS